MPSDEFDDTKGDDEDDDDDDEDDDDSDEDYTSISEGSESGIAMLVCIGVMCSVYSTAWYFQT